ncbi:cytochrome P450, partial [Bisporella sp. PMI_857]
YAVSRCVYILHFHPLSKFPGLQIAAFSNIWYGYHWQVDPSILKVSGRDVTRSSSFRLSGRYPWAIENALSKYGDVVRVAPNELVFLTPQATPDICSSHQRGNGAFLKTDFNNRGKDLGGLVWEGDPVRHQKVAKKFAPAFSKRSIGAMDPFVHQYVSTFVERMRQLGEAADGVGLVDWTTWLAMDLSADLSWNDKMHEMRDKTNALILQWKTPPSSKLSLVSMYLLRHTSLQALPLIKPIQCLFVHFGKLKSLAEAEKITRLNIQKRVDGRNDLEHSDFFKYLVPADSPLPKDPRELTHLGSVSLQLMFAGYGPMSDWFYATLIHLLEEVESYKPLTEEIRNAFTSYNDITSGSLASLQYLHACLEESLRVFPSNSTGLPRLNPGAVVDGHYVPGGVRASPYDYMSFFFYYTMFAFGRSPRPQRWLASSHPLYDSKYAKDDLKGQYPFSIGPRHCLGKELAWMEGMLFLAKVL